MNDAIKLAIEKGGYAPMAGKPHFEIGMQQVYFFAVKGSHEQTLSFEQILLDPLFWQALGKALGNKAEMICNSPKCDSKLCEYAGYKNPKHMFDSYMECIWYGYDKDKFWKELLNK